MMKMKIKQPPIALRIGIVGNRDLSDANTKVLQQTLHALLINICQSVEGMWERDVMQLNCALYANEAPSFYLINSLAEGADQLAAQAAVDVPYDFKLVCPLAFTTERYLQNFTTDSDRQQFDSLLDVDFDSVVIEMDCNTDHKNKKNAYRLAADMLLENTDILIAIYDDDKDGGVGGSLNTVNIALQRGLPVFHIHPKTPKGGRLYRSAKDLKYIDKTYTINDINACVKEIILPFNTKDCVRLADIKKTGNKANSYYDALDFFDEALLHRSSFRFYLSFVIYCFYAPVWKILFGVLNLFDCPPKINLCADDTSDQPISGMDTTTITSTQEPFKKQKEQLEVLAGFYMDLYRGSFILNFILGSVAVSLAVMSFFGNGHSGWSIAELVCLLVIVISYWINRACGWQKKAVDYRFMAEYFRHIEMLVLLGRNTWFLETAAHYYKHDPGKTWMGWYLKAFTRSIAPFEGYYKSSVSSSRRTVIRLDKNYLRLVKRIICKQWLEDQYRYHISLQKRYSAWGTVASVLMCLLFVGTISGVVMHMMGNPFGHPEGWHEDVVLAFIVTVFPAFLAAIHGITIQGEFERLAERSGDIVYHLKDTINQLNEIQSNNKTHHSEIDAVADLIHDAAQMMFEEITDWQVLYRAHEVELT